MLAVDAREERLVALRARWVEVVRRRFVVERDLECAAEALHDGYRARLAAGATRSDRIDELPSITPSHLGPKAPTRKKRLS